MPIISQPRQKHLLYEINRILTANSNCEEHIFYMVVAYVRRSGVVRIRDAINYFRENGGRVVAVSGVDQNTTTVQGLLELLDITDELYVYHSQNFAQTFHPKVYAYQAGKRTAEVFIGSSNLTAGGLFTNYEMNYHRQYDFENTEDLEEYRLIEQFIASYSNTSSQCCLRVDRDLLEQLSENNYLGNESVRTRSSSGDTIYGGATPDEHEAMFGLDRFEPPPTVVIRVSESSESGRDEDATIPIINELREGFWKILSNNDISLTSSPGQIIIPIRFLPIFPPFTELNVTPSGGRQADVYFNVFFNSNTGSRLLIRMVRTIHYIPAPTHARPNQEIRFTFRNREILESLNSNDILLFRRTDNPDIWFEIFHIDSAVSEFDGIQFNGRYAAF